MSINIGGLDVTVHRTVRVPIGSNRAAALPPSLGYAQTFKVSDYTGKVPTTWDTNGVFIPAWDTEAIWLSFSSMSPVALLVGAGGINAVSGKPLTTKLGEGNYLVAPPQPWLDGFKNEDGNVYQFVATPYQGGKGNTVGEQILGEQSKSGGIGIAVFDPKVPIVVPQGYRPATGHVNDVYGNNAYGNNAVYGASASVGMDFGAQASYSTKSLARSSDGVTLDGARLEGAGFSLRSAHALNEMGVGKGGLITQKVYADPYGIATWRDSPTATMAIYLVDAALAKEVLGVPVAPPASSDSYKGNYFHVNDGGIQDTKGSPVFKALKDAKPTVKVGSGTVFSE